MAGELRILGIRHHGPGSARMVSAALESLTPDAVLIEGPPDAAELLGLAAHKEMSPPVALLVYEPDEPKNAAYYPFASFSPEWVAIRWALEHKAEVKFIDLPKSLRVPPAEPKGDEAGAESAADEPDESPPDDKRLDPLDSLAGAAGFSDGEAWWGRLIEELRGDHDPLAVFTGIHDAMAALREDSALGTRHSALDPDEPAREAHMRRAIRAAIKEGFERIAVVCGAWHVPVLTAEALKAIPARDDDEKLKGLPKRKTAATWIPWTNSRLSMFSGYGAGIASPGWYEHLWSHRSLVAEKWMTRVARLMRDEDLDAAPASVIEAVRLADSLAALRGRATAGLDELGEATLAILCHGNEAPMHVIARKLIVGERLGEIPAEAPAVPLQRDLAAQQRSLRLKVSADDTILELDQRKEIDLARSRLLHRLCLLDVDWGRLDEHGSRSKGTFRETWRLQWKPEFAVNVIEAAVYGHTVEDAAAGCVIDRAAKATDLPSLTQMLDHVLLADLPRAVAILVARIQAVSAVSADVAHLMAAIPPLASVLRYGNVRKTDAAMVEPVLAGLAARACAGLPPACASLNDEAAANMSGGIRGVDAALVTLERDDLLEPWRQMLRRLGDGAGHGLVKGRCWRLLLDAGAAAADEVAQRLSLALSPGNDPAVASAWLEGFLSGSGAILVHDSRLLGLIDAWVCTLPGDLFETTSPILRRTFSTFEAPERRMIGDKIKRTDGAPAAAVSRTAAPGDGRIDEARAELVMPVLRLILGEGIG